MNLILSLKKKDIRQVKEFETQQPLRVCFNFHGAKIIIYTNSSYMADHLNLAYNYFERDSVGDPQFSLLALESGKPGHEEICKSLFPRREVKDHILISRDLNLIIFLRDCPLLAFYTVKFLFGEVIRPLHKQFLGIHAAALSKNGRGLLLCGAARCGKTVLTSLLLQKGFGYCSDDVTLVSRDTMQVVPFPRALNIREEYEKLAAPMLQKARRVGHFKIADQKRVLVDLTDSVVGEATPKVIFFPGFDKNSKSKSVLQPVSPCNAMVTLMHQRFHPLIESLYNYDVQDFEFCGQLLENLVCYNLVYSDPVDAAKVIDHIIMEKSDNE